MMKQIQTEINKILTHLNEYHGLVNCHMVDYFSNELFERCLPVDIKEEINNRGYDGTLEYIFKSKQAHIDNDSNIQKFLKENHNLTLSSNAHLCLTLDKLITKLIDLGSDNIKGLKLDVFMNPKKSHEVEILSAISASLKQIGRTTHLIDIGDGKGYLSSLLALHYNIPVLGVDCSAINTNSAIKRAHKLSRSWQGVVKTSTKTENGNFNYRQITKYVTEDTNLKELVDDVFMQKSEGLSLVGLHTCGNLAASSLKIFTSNKDVRTICNVSCCYNLLTEKHEVEDHLKSKTGFPMSDFLKEKDFQLGQRLRMLSAQSVDRILFKQELPNKTIFYRAVLEIMLNERCPDLKSRILGRFKKQPNNFMDYVKDASKRLSVDFGMSDEDIRKFEVKYQDRVKQLYCFNLLRCTMAPVIESLILLDRLLYLKERNVENSYLVQLFDPVISPRCYGLVAFKGV